MSDVFFQIKSREDYYKGHLHVLVRTDSGEGGLMWSGYDGGGATINLARAEWRELITKVAPLVGMMVAGEAETND